MVDEEEKERVRLVEADLAQTNEFVKGVLTTGAALRTSAVTTWLALLGFALQQRLAVLALLAAVVAALFLVVDGYHGWLYTQAARHARSIQLLLARYYDALSRGEDDPDVVTAFRAALRAHRFGMFRNFRRRFILAQLWFTRPTWFYRVFYPFLILLALGVVVLVQLGIVGNPAPPPPTRVIIESTTPR